MKEDRCLELGRQLCFPLYAASREVVRKYKPFLDELGLTYTQYIVMLVLWEEGKISMQELGNRLYLDSGTLTPLLVKLEEKGLVEKARNEKDVREIIVSVTDKGVGLKVQAREIPGKIGKCLNISVIEAVQLKKILNKILE
ncbi:MarR family transcriptional regulator [Candidatus Saccharibacteria bacterium]|nr:MarR family transcriptional regulator [Candidatus Saccharibacteria bacterium]